MSTQNKVYRVGPDASVNREVLPHRPGKFQPVLDFSFYTLTKIADAIHYTYPTADTIAMHCRYALKCACADLVVDQHGNFVSLTKIEVGSPRQLAAA